ncbi:MAG: AAA family ATPase [Bacteroidales bacterium]|nr:AAA family ATPase [Bacteroidales bacterium]
MSENYFLEHIFRHLQHEPTNAQKEALGKLFYFLSSIESNEIFILKGYAGTGKTSLLSALIKSLPSFGINSILMAPTGRAAKVLSSFAEKPAYTIHKIIYRQNSKSDVSKGFALNFNKYKNTIFIVDEASMITGRSEFGSPFGSGCLFCDLIQFIENGSNCKLILCGDDAQLPPVESDESPALQKDYVESFGYKAIVSQMNDIVRQALDSGILSNANLIRKAIQTLLENIPRLKTIGFTDVEKIDGTNLIETIETHYNNNGIDETKIITRTNKQANKYNQGIKSRILWHEEELVPGDRLMVVKNNYFWLPENSPIDFIANGDMINLIRLRSSYNFFNTKFYDAVISLSDNSDFEIELKILVDSLHVEAASLPSEFYSNLYKEIEADYSHIENNKKRAEAVLNDQFFNALQIKHAYAITCHKAQGGQWDVVFIDHGWLPDTEPDIAFFRWLYTAITRAKEKLYFVNFKPEFVEN